MVGAYIEKGIANPDDVAKLTAFVSPGLSVTCVDGVTVGLNSFIPHEPEKIASISMASVYSKYASPIYHVLSGLPPLCIHVDRMRYC